MHMSRSLHLMASSRDQFSTDLPAKRYRQKIIMLASDDKIKLDNPDYLLSSSIRPALSTNLSNKTVFPRHAIHPTNSFSDNSFTISLDLQANRVTEFNTKLNMAPYHAPGLSADTLADINTRWESFMNSVVDHQISERPNDVPKAKRAISFDETVICYQIPRLDELIEEYDRIVNSKVNQSQDQIEHFDTNEKSPISDCSEHVADRSTYYLPSKRDSEMHEGELIVLETSETTDDSIVCGFFQERTDNIISAPLITIGIGESQIPGAQSSPSNGLETPRPKGIISSLTVPSSDSAHSMERDLESSVFDYTTSAMDSDPIILATTYTAPVGRAEGLDDPVLKKNLTRVCHYSGQYEERDQNVVSSKTSSFWASLRKRLNTQKPSSRFF